MEPIASDPAIAAQSLQVVFLVDITGSMGSQIEGVKQMISKFCEVDRPLIDVHIWTYTESPGCYVSKSPVGLKSQGLVEYTMKIKLCCPPDFPEITGASGGDGPENVVAGIAALLDSFDPKQNVLCFPITDASPHHICLGKGGTAMKEVEWLNKAGFDSTDIFCILCEVIDSLNITFVPVLYNGAESNVWYQQAAVMTDGIILVPQANTSESLAEGLVILLEAFQQLSIDRNIQFAKTIDVDKISQAFMILDIPVEDFGIIEEDPNDAKLINHVYEKMKGSEDILRKILELFETTVDRFSGKKSAKRCRAVNVEHVSKSIKFFLMAMLYVSDSHLFNSEEFENNKRELVDLLKVLEQKDKKYEWETRLLNTFISTLEGIKGRFEHNQHYIHELNQPIQCMVSLETVSNSLKELNQIPISEEDLSQYMDLILQLSLVRLIQVNFPLDASQKPDFADAWSASIRSIEYSSVLSASSALALRNKADCLYTAPISLNKNNAALLIAHPNDLQLTELYKSLSFLPTLQGLIQSHLISGSFKVFPSITFGLQASTLWFILRVRKSGFKFAEYEWEFVRCLVHSLQNSAQNPASEVFNAAKSGKALNPVDSIAKILTGVLAYFRRNEVSEEKARLLARLTFEELSADIIAWEIRRATNAEGKLENCVLPSDNDIAGCFVDFEELSKFNPLGQVHYSELICKKNQHLGDGFLQQVSKKVFEKSEIVQNTVRVFQAYCVLLKCDLNKHRPEEAYESVSSEWANGLVGEELLGEIFIESLVIKKRTARYKLQEDTKEWVRESIERISNESVHKACVDILKDCLKATFTKWTAARLKWCREENWNKATHLIGDSFESFNSQLAEISTNCGDVTIKPTRLDVVEIFSRLEKNRPDFSIIVNTLGLALIIGDWTKAPVSQLRRHLSTLVEHFKAFPESYAIIDAEVKKEAVCCRPVEKPNRHGHHLENVYPGICYWTSEYEEKAKSAKKKAKKKLGLHLNELRLYTEYFQSIDNEVLQSGNFSENKKNLIQWCLTGHKEARILEKVKKFVERIKMLEFKNSEEKEWDSEVKSVLIKLAKSRKPWIQLEKFLKKVENA